MSARAVSSASGLVCFIVFSCVCILINIKSHFAEDVKSWRVDHHTKNLSPFQNKKEKRLQTNPAASTYDLPTTVAQAVDQVDGMKSVVNPKVLAEGVVWWNKNNETFPELDDRANFKAINNKFLLKNGE